MASPAYERLSAQDASFLQAEGPSTPMHVAAVFVVESGPLRTAGAGVDVERIRRSVASRLHRIPRYRQRIELTPLTRTPIWVDDRHFDLEYHLRHTSLPRPGDMDQLRRLASRVTAQPLDRAKPLWEIWIAEGLDGGERFALVSKVHHCMVDGVSGTELMTILMSADPSDAPDETAPPFHPRPLPGRGELARDDLLRLARGPQESAQRIRELLSAGADVRESLRSVWELATQGLRSASVTPLNHPLGPHRRCDWLALDLGEVKAVKGKLGVSVNDVVLATVAGALRSFLRRRRVEVAELDFRVTAPVSMRSDEERATPGNRVAAWIVPLPLAEEDPLQRAARIHETTRRLKDSRQALGADMLSAVTEWTGTTLLSLGTRLQGLVLPHNMIVTNVPGPQVPLYLCGARLVETYPFVPLFQNQGLGIGIFSYAGRLFFGLNADADLVPDVSEVRRALARSFEELARAAGTGTVFTS